MITTNPFSVLSETISPIVMQSFVIAMVTLVFAGTLLDILHKKNVKYFFQNAKKAKKSAKKNLTTSEKTTVVLKTIASDIATTSELGAGKRRAAHLLGMYGTILFWIGSVIMIFCYSTPFSETPFSCTWRSARPTCRFCRKSCTMVPTGNRESNTRGKIPAGPSSPRQTPTWRSGSTGFPPTFFQ